MSVDGVAPSENAVPRLPVISFVITNYNYRLYLRDCVDSIVAQTYPHLECVIVDDASTDDSLELIHSLCAQHPQLNIRVIARESNRGQLSSMLAGLEATHGEFVAFVDADDILSPEFAARHVTTHLLATFPVGFTSCSNADISGTGVLLAGNSVNTISNAAILGHPIADFVRPVAESRLHIPGLQAFPEKAFVIGDTADFWLWAPTSGLVWRRDALIFATPSDIRSLTYYGDFYFAVLINAISSSIFFDEVLVYYRRHFVNQFAGLPRLGGRTQVGIPRRSEWRLAKEIMLDHVFERLQSFFDVIGAERLPLFLQCLAKSQEFRRDQPRIAAELLPPRMIANYARFEALAGPEYAVRTLVSFVGRRAAFDWIRRIEPGMPRRWWLLIRALRWRIMFSITREP